MKFDSLFDYKYFVKGVEGSITDDALSLRVKNAKGNEINDTDYFLLTDSVDSYIGELKHHSKEKKFFKMLQSEELNDSNLPNLFALLTHLSLGLCDRRKVRDSVDLTHFQELRNMVDSLVSEILKSGTAENKLLDLLKKDA
jgi:hypothetical protein